MPDGLLVIADLALVIAVAHVGGLVAARTGQRRIVGEMLAVMLVGPTLLGGQVAGTARGVDGHGAVATLFPEISVDILTVLGMSGLALYMLLVGFTIEPAPLRRHGRTIGLLVLAVTGAALVLALIAGPLLVHAGGWKPLAESQAAFVLALVAGLVANGVPIVARVLEDETTERSPAIVVAPIILVSATGVTAIGLVLSAIAIQGGDATAVGRVAVRAGAGLAALSAVLAVLRSSSRSLSRRAGFATVLLLAGCSAAAGWWLISTALLGPLVVGIAVPADGQTARDIERRLGSFARRVLMPVFLGAAALHADLRELWPDALAPAVALIAAVLVVKLAAGSAVARAAHFPPGEARAIGALLQCGGIMTIAISLAVLRADVITPRMHATLTLVGLVSTIATGPLLARARRI